MVGSGRMSGIVFPFPLDCYSFWGTCVVFSVPVFTRRSALFNSFCGHCMCGKDLKGKLSCLLAQCCAGSADFPVGTRVRACVCACLCTHHCGEDVRNRGGIVVDTNTNQHGTTAHHEHSTTWWT